jgi:hypothetical protein
MGEGGAVLEVNTSVSGIRVVDSTGITFRGVTIIASARVPLSGDVFNLSNTRGFSLLDSEVRGPSRYVVAVHNGSSGVLVADDVFEGGVWFSIVYADTSASVVVENVSEGQANVLVMGRGYEGVVIRNVTLTRSVILFMLRNVGSLIVSSVDALNASSIGQVDGAGSLVVEDLRGHGSLYAYNVGDARIENIVLSGGDLYVDAANATIEYVSVDHGIIHVGLSNKCRGSGSFTIENISLVNATLDTIPVFSGPSSNGGLCTLNVVYRNVSIEVSSLKTKSYAIVDLGSNWNGYTLAENIRVVSHVDPGATITPILRVLNATLRDVSVTGINATGVWAMFSTLENVSVYSPGKPLYEGIILQDSNATGISVDNAVIGVEYSAATKKSSGVIAGARVNASTGLLLSTCDECYKSLLRIRDSEFTVSRSFIDYTLTLAPMSVRVFSTSIRGAPDSHPSLAGSSTPGNELKLYLFKVDIRGLSLYPSLGSAPGGLYLNAADTLINDSLLTAVSGYSNETLDLGGRPAVVFLRDTLNVTVENFRAAENVGPATLLLFNARNTVLRNFTLSGVGVVRGSSLTIEYMSASKGSRLILDNRTSASIYLSTLYQDTLQGEPRYVLLSSPVVEYEYEGRDYIGMLGNHWLGLNETLTDYNGDGLLDLKPVAASNGLRDYWALAGNPTEYRVLKTIPRPPSIAVLVYKAGGSYVVEARAYTALCTAKLAKLYVNGEKVKTLVLLPRTWVKLDLKPGDRIGLECNYEWANTTVPLPSGGHSPTTTTTSPPHSTSSPPQESTASMPQVPSRTSVGTMPLPTGKAPSGGHSTAFAVVVVAVLAVAAALVLARKRG